MALKIKTLAEYQERKAIYDSRSVAWHTAPRKSAWELRWINGEFDRMRKFEKASGIIRYPAFIGSDGYSYVGV